MLLDPVGIADHAALINLGTAGNCRQGSADAAAVLTALNKISQTGLSKAELCEIGAAVGSDVPFCIIGGAAVGTGTGTTLMALPPLPDCALLIAKPSLSI